MDRPYERGGAEMRWYRAVARPQEQVERARGRKRQEADPQRERGGAGSGGKVAEKWMGATWVQPRLVHWLWGAGGGKRERQALGANELAILSQGRRPCHQARGG